MNPPDILIPALLLSIIGGALTIVGCVFLNGPSDKEISSAKWVLTFSIPALFIGAALFSWFGYADANTSFNAREEMEVVHGPRYDIILDAEKGPVNASKYFGVARVERVWKTWRRGYGFDFGYKYTSPQADNFSFSGESDDKDTK
jgi:hypothetical protein